MGNHAGKRELSAEKVNKDGGPSAGESDKKRDVRQLSREASEDNEVFGEADVERNNGTPSQDTAVTDSKRTANPKNAWQDANPADPGGRPHLIRLFSRDAPGREDNTFKDRPSESDELQTIQEDSAATPEGLDVMASQKRPSQRHGSKYLASASAMDHARHGFLPRHRDAGILDSLGRFFGGDRGAPKRGSGKVRWLKQRRSPVPSHAHSPPGLCAMYQDGHHAARTAHYGSLPQKSQHGRPQDENPVVHFFKNIVTPRTPPPSQGKNYAAWIPSSPG
ncbi:myelin basic protein isoform X6 [Ursus maritimus]|uniref:Myelin basic protein n=1 Tax=Ursus maritimus TaxID=29073 RepID=A0A8M1G1H2_URSMA|nr:myelin basic protein isoform X6 [Ursus maritimus]